MYDLVSSVYYEVIKQFEYSEQIRDLRPSCLLLNKMKTKKFSFQVTLFLMTMCRVSKVIYLQALAGGPVRSKWKMISQE